MATPYAGGPLKRALDVAIAAPMLVLTAPIVAVAAIAVALTSPGGALFSQERVGRDRRPFNCYKLRTMGRDTPSVPTHEAPPAAVTRVGRVLRATKIDELPQLWNVLCGEMSLVGPRPCLPSQTDLITERDRRGVFAVRPGITGLAQVEGVDMSDPPRLAELDARYIATASPLLDFNLLARTAFPSGSR